MRNATLEDYVCPPANVNVVNPGAAPEVKPISLDDAMEIAHFFHAQLNERVTADQWARLLMPPWEDGSAPNRGFQLVADGTVVGACAAVYSHRDIEGEGRAVCNLAAFCVLPDYRPHSVRLVRALLGQRGYVFTDFSPSGNVVAMNERLGFRHLDTAGRLLVNLPSPVPARVRVTDDPAVLSARLRGPDADAFRDHRQAAATRHLLVETDAAYAYLVYRRERRKGLPLFAVPLYVGGERDLLRMAWPRVGAHLLRRGLPFTLAERRLIGFTPSGPGRTFEHNRYKMFRDKGTDGASLDYLYSELTLVEW
ncbi:hypothetical protein G3T36_02820 [Diaminobutyricibacter tongyongensis]|uniref:GNAT family N-acetyltransferase n=1 Tax=Leifsonia tongyongensis TaxID=1268043 RepID=A0A6L9XUP0_9MICO|nr:hypothetical protein [Diaminobutyricibacter tongyongensis]NEN04794.1 hypothetical protein [Diaminobutyricibacter tongyongensis]